MPVVAYYVIICSVDTIDDTINDTAEANKVALQLYDDKMLAVAQGCIALENSIAEDRKKRKRQDKEEENKLSELKNLRKCKRIRRNLAVSNRHHQPGTN